MYGDKPGLELPKRYLLVWMVGKMVGRLWGWKLKRQLAKEVKKRDRFPEIVEDEFGGSDSSIDWDSEHNPS